MTDIPKPAVAESAEYDNFVGKKTELPEPPTLSKFLFDDEVDPNTLDLNEREDHWRGMPEFVQEEKKTFQTIYVHFRSQEDVDEFSKLIGQTITKKTKSIWHPKLNRDENSLKRWIEDDES